MSLQSATCSDRTRSAVFTRPPMAARRGRTRTSSTKTPDSPMLRWIPRIRTCSMPRRTSGAGRHGASTAAARAAVYGRPAMRARHGRSCRAMDSRRPSQSAESVSTSPVRSRRRFTRRSKSAPSGGTGAGVNADGSLQLPGQGRGGPGGPGRPASSRTPLPRRLTRRKAGCGARTTAARPGGSYRTRGTAGCTTARSASIRPIPKSRTRVARHSSRPSTAARSGGAARHPSQRSSRHLDQSARQPAHSAR